MPHMTHDFPFLERGGTVLTPRQEHKFREMFPDFTIKYSPVLVLVDYHTNVSNSTITWSGSWAHGASIHFDLDSTNMFNA